MQVVYLESVAQVCFRKLITWTRLHFGVAEPGAVASENSEGTWQSKQSPSNAYNFTTFDVHPSHGSSAQDQNTQGPGMTMSVPLLLVSRSSSEGGWSRTTLQWLRLCGEQ